MNTLSASPLMLSLCPPQRRCRFFSDLSGGRVGGHGRPQKTARGDACLACFIRRRTCGFRIAKITESLPVLTGVFLLGVGFACNAPAWTSVIPDVVTKEELASAVTLGVCR